MQEGNLFTISPIINQGTNQFEKWNDGFTYVTKDGLRSAQFKHTILITKEGYEIITARDDKSPSLEYQD